MTDLQNSHKHSEPTMKICYLYFLTVNKEKTDFDHHREFNNKTQNDLIEINNFTPAKYVNNSTLTKPL